MAQVKPRTTREGRERFFFSFFFSSVGWRHKTKWELNDNKKKTIKRKEKRRTLKQKTNSNENAEDSAHFSVLPTERRYSEKIFDRFLLRFTFLMSSKKKIKIEWLRGFPVEAAVLRFQLQFCFSFAGNSRKRLDFTLGRPETKWN